VSFTDQKNKTGVWAPTLAWQDSEGEQIPDLINVERGGKIVSIHGFDDEEPMYAWDFEKEAPKTWGDPPTKIRQVVITVQTDEADSSNPADDGKRTIWIQEESLKYSKKHKTKAGLPKPGTRFGALMEALETAGVAKQDPKVGGEFYLARTGQEKGLGPIPRGLWRARYVPPSSGVFNTPAVNQQSSGVSETSPFDQPAADPKETLRAAAMLEINEATNTEDLKRIHAKYAKADIWTAEQWRELGQKQLARPKVAASPFD
jgi:hypothetical protein